MSGSGFWAACGCFGPLKTFSLVSNWLPSRFFGIMPLTACRMSFSGCLARNLGNGGVFLAAFPAGIAHVFLGGFLLAGEPDLFGVDDNDKIAGVEVGREDGLVFAA